MSDNTADLRVVYTDAKLCAECGGKCCKRMPGSAHPDDFGQPLKENLIAAFRSGNWAVDWWEGDPRPGMYELPRGLFVRPAIKGVYRLMDPSWGGECTFLTNTGCSLPYDKRPAICRLLEPSKTECISHWGPKDIVALTWLPFTDIILEAVDEAGRRA